MSVSTRIDEMMFVEVGGNQMVYVWTNCNAY